MRAGSNRIDECLGEKGVKYTGMLHCCSFSHLRFLGACQRLGWDCHCHSNKAMNMREAESGVSRQSKRREYERLLSRSAERENRRGAKIVRQRAREREGPEIREEDQGREGYCRNTQVCGLALLLLYGNVVSMKWNPALRQRTEQG